MKKYVLNDLLLSRIGDIQDTSILEIGAGNGYFVRLLRRRKSGQQPARFVVTDASGAMLRLAQDNFPVPWAEYLQLDARRQFPFESGEFDLILASMVFNELRDSDLVHALNECHRVLVPSGRMLATVTHPEFVSRLEKQGKLREPSPGFFTMPGKGSMRLPVIPRSEAAYSRSLARSGFEFEQVPVFPSEMVINERPGLRHVAGSPLGLLFVCER